MNQPTKNARELTSHALIEEIFRPMLLHMYEQANLAIPEKFCVDVEGPRIVAALRTQGFNSRFPVVKK